MSSPVSLRPISVQLDAVEALAAELAALATALGDEAALCSSTARSLPAALSGLAGERAGAGGAAWGRLTGVLAERAQAIATTLSAAVASYRAADAALAGRIGIPAPGRAVAR